MCGFKVRLFLKGGLNGRDNNCLNDYSFAYLSCEKLDKLN